MPTSQAMILRAFGLRAHLGKEDLVDRIDVMDGKRDEGTDTTGWPKVASSLGLRAIEISGPSVQVKAEQVLAHLDQGHVLMLTGDAAQLPWLDSRSSSHAVVASEHKNGAVLIHDPLEPQGHWLSEAALTRFLSPDTDEFAFDSYTVQGAAERLGMKPAAISALVARGRLHGEPGETETAIPAAEVERFLDEEHAHSFRGYAPRIAELDRQRSRIASIVKANHEARDAELQGIRGQLAKREATLSNSTASGLKGFLYDKRISTLRDSSPPSYWQPAEIAENNRLRERLKAEIERHGAAHYNPEYAETLSALVEHQSSDLRSSVKVYFRGTTFEAEWKKVVDLGPDAFHPSYDRALADAAKNPQRHEELLRSGPEGFNPVYDKRLTYLQARIHDSAEDVRKYGGRSYDAERLEAYRAEYAALRSRSPSDYDADYDLHIDELRRSVASARANLNQRTAYWAEREARFGPELGRLDALKADAIRHGSSHYDPERQHALELQVRELDVSTPALTRSTHAANEGDERGRR